MANLARAEDRNLLKAVFNFARARKLKPYIVGGYLRDIILKRKKDNPDIDFCLKKNAISFGRLLSNKIKAGFVVLDKEHGACRLVKRIKGKTYTLDFTDFRGKTLQEDLLHRDFTINTLAMELGTDTLIDTRGAAKDLKSKTIKLAHQKSFDEDPLRILRAFSFSAMLGFKIDKGTLRLIELKKNKLSGVSFERVRDELFKILDSGRAFDYLQQLDKLKILRLIFPEIELMRGVNQGPYHHLDIWKHTLETVRQLDLLIGSLKNNRDIQDYLNDAISSERKRRALIKLGALLHDIGKPQALIRQGRKTIFHGHERIGAEIAEGIAQRLKLSNDESASLKRMVFWHLRPGFLADNEEVSPRARFRYFRDTLDEAVSTLLLSIADQRATRGPLTTRASRVQHERIVFGLIKEYFQKKKEEKPPRLINGDDLIREFKLESSPLIGKILRETQELQAIGKIKTKQDALRAAGRFVHKK